MWNLGLLGAAWAGVAGSYELIESSILTSNASSVTFSSIPQDYKHLQIRASVRDTNIFSTTLRNLPLRFNGDTGNNYFGHELLGEGSGVFSQSLGTPTSSIRPRATIDDSSAANIFVPSIWDILDYSNTSKNTTVRILSGSTGPTGGDVPIIALSSGAWNNTAAITSISVGSAESNKTGSRFSLYGIRGE
jgi:hypothetical protein